MAYNTKIQLGLYEYKNSHFIKQAIIDDYYEISFTRNLYEAGDFTITINKNIPNASLFKRGLFVRFGNDDYDMGEIVSISTSVGAEGKASETLLINGKDLRYLFHRRIIIQDNANGKWEMTGKGEIVLRSLAKDQCGIGTESKRRLPIENNIPTVDNAIGGECSISEAFTNLYEVMTTIATQTNTGWRVKYHDGNLTLECFSGVDRSKNVFFTVSHDALQEGNFVDSSESFANTVYVGGKGQGDERDIYEGENENPENMDRFEAWDDQSSMTDESEYEAEAGAMLTQYGQTINVSGNTLAKSPYIYKEQYDVGDIVTIGFSDQKAVTQILSVTENWSGRGHYSTSFSFGKPLPTLNNQLQLILKQIRKASDNSSSTDSVRWYTIPTDTEMPKADVTYTTIGFIGDCGENGSTFKLYFNSNETGSKTYHVWLKQLAGTGKLTLTTGVAGKQNLVLNTGTYVAIIYVDQEGNVLSQGSTPVNTVTAGNTQPVTSGAVSSAIASIGNDYVSKTLIDASTLITITNVSSTTHTVTKGNIHWGKCYAVKFNNNRYFVQGEVEIGNGYGCTISPNTDIKISIDTNFPAYSFTNVIFNAVIGGYVGLIPTYTRDIYDMWLRNISSTNIPWNNSNTLILKFSLWI